MWAKKCKRWCVAAPCGAGNTLFEVGISYATEVIENARDMAVDEGKQGVAVLIAEEVTSRFLNVMSLLAGSIPPIAIQLNAIQVGDKLALDFVKVLDQRALREDDTVDTTEGDEVGRPAWEKKVGENGVALCDELVSLLQPHTDCELGLRFQKRHVPVVPVGTTRDVAFVVWPRRTFMRIQVRAENLVALQDQLKEVGIDTNMVFGGTRLRFNLSAADLTNQSEAIIDVLSTVIRQKGL